MALSLMRDALSPACDECVVSAFGRVENQTASEAVRERPDATERTIPSGPERSCDELRVSTD